MIFVEFPLPKALERPSASTGAPLSKRGTCVKTRHLCVRALRTHTRRVGITFSRRTSRGSGVDRTAPEVREWNDHLPVSAPLYWRGVCVLKRATCVCVPCARTRTEVEPRVFRDESRTSFRGRSDRAGGARRSTGSAKTARGRGAQRGERNAGSAARGAQCEERSARSAARERSASASAARAAQPDAARPSRSPTRRDAASPRAAATAAEAKWK